MGTDFVAACSPEVKKSRRDDYSRDTGGNLIGSLRDMLSGQSSVPEGQYQGLIHRMRNRARMGHSHLEVYHLISVNADRLKDEGFTVREHYSGWSSIWW